MKWRTVVYVYPKHGLRRNFMQRLFGRQWCFATGKNRTNVVLQEAACTVNPFQVFALLIVIYSLAAIAFYRYRFIVNPLPRTPSSVKTITILTISGLWLLSFAIACPYFFGLRFRNGNCEELPVVNNRSYVAIRFILNYALPYVIMLASCGAVAWNLRRRIVQIERLNRDLNVVPSRVDETELQELRGGTRMEKRRLSFVNNRSYVAIRFILTTLYLM